MNISVNEQWDYEPFQVLSESGFSIHMDQSGQLCWYIPKRYIFGSDYFSSQGHWGCKRNAKRSMALHLYGSFHTFLVWATHAVGDLSSKTRLPLGLRLGLGWEFREPQILQLPWHWGCKKHAEGSTALHLHWSLHIFLMLLSQKLCSVTQHAIKPNFRAQKWDIVYYRPVHLWMLE